MDTIRASSDIISESFKHDDILKIECLEVNGDHISEHVLDLTKNTIISNDPERANPIISMVLHIVKVS